MCWVGTGEPLLESRSLWHQAYTTSLWPHTPCCPGRTVGEYRHPSQRKIRCFGDHPLSVRFLVLFTISLSPHGSERHLAWIWVQAPTTLWMPWTTTLCNQMGLRARGSWDSLTPTPPRQDAEKQRKRWREGTGKGTERRERERELLGFEFQTLLPVSPKASPSLAPPKNGFEPMKNSFFIEASSSLVSTTRNQSILMSTFYLTLASTPL